MLVIPGAGRNAWSYRNAWVTESEKKGFIDRVTMEGGSDSCVVRRIPLDAEQVRNFYHITSKEAFWPILHSFAEHFSSRPIKSPG